MKLFDCAALMYTKYKRLLRFAVVGCINTGVDFLTFTLLHGAFQTDKLICQLAGYSMGVANSFILNKLWTFESHNSKYESSWELLRFIIVNAVSLGVSLLGLQILNGNLKINVYISKVIVTVLAQAVNYLGYKLWVFKNKSQAANTKPEF